MNNTETLLTSDTEDTEQHRDTGNIGKTLE